MKRRHKFNGQRCVYCGAEAETSDHAVARKFFLEERRDNLPQVPACQKCNNRKAELERYLMTILPFGAKHPDAVKNLEKLVRPRLENDAKLRRKLERGFAKSGGTTLPFDGKLLEELFAMIAKALAWQQFGVLLGEGDGAIAAMFRDDGESFFEDAFQSIVSRGGNHVSGDLGDGTFRYEGVQLKESPQHTAWRFWIYGGVEFGGDPSVPGPSSLAVAVTGPSGMIRNLRERGAFKEATDRKIGRNDPCPCGSGKKHKKCCGAVTPLGTKSSAA